MAKRILLADDNKQSLKLLRAIYDAEGYDVEVATDGKEAMDILLKTKVDLIVSDVLMPNVDGYYLCFKVRESEKLRNIPIIIYTATYTSESEAKVAMEMGADRFIRKPAAIKTLLDAAKDLLENPKRHQAMPGGSGSFEIMHQYSSDLISKLEQRNMQLERMSEDLELTLVRFKRAEEIAHMGHWSLDLSTQESIWSDVAFAIYGLQLGSVEPSYEVFIRAVHPDDRDQVEKVTQGALQNLSPFSVAHRIVLPNGKVKAVLSAGNFEFDRAGNAIRLFGVSLDLTLIADKEQKLAEAHNRLRFHIENTPLGFIEWDDQLRLTTCSRRAEEIFGWTEKEFKESRRSAFDLVFGPDLAAFRETADNLLTGKADRNKVQHLNVTRDGKVIWCEWFNSVQRHNSGKANTIMSLIQDVTDKVNTETLLQDFHEQHEIVSKATNDAIWDWDIKKDTVQWNHGIESIFGYKERKWTSSAEWWKRTIHPDDYQRTEDELQEAFAKFNTNWTSQYRYLAADGTYKYVLDRAYIVFKEGQPVRVIGAMQDVTEIVQYRKGLEKMVEERTQKLNQALNKEKELVELKSKFISIASHEFRTPLSTIALATGFIKKYKAKLAPEEVDQKLENIEKQVSQMTYLLDDVLTIGKAEAGKIKLSFSDVSSNIFENLAREALRSTGASHRLVFKQHKAPPSLTTDEKLLRNIVINLITNATKFSPDSVEVHVDVEWTQSTVVLTIEDYGIGIPPTDLKNLFTSFSRGSNVGTIEGSGLGLSIVKKATELLEGNIDVSSQEGSGTKFTVTLPLKNA